MIPIFFICHSITEDSQDLSAFMGKTRKSTVLGTVGHYGFTTIEETKKRS